MLSILSSALRTATRSNNGLGGRLTPYSECEQNIAEHERRKREELHRQNTQNQHFLRHWSN